MLSLVRFMYLDPLSDFSLLKFINKLNRMNISKAIQRGDLEALRANEHEIIQDVNDMLEQSSIEWENYITYWMAAHQDHEIATEMFKIFMNTCKTAFKPEKYESVMSLYAHATMISAIATENIEILDLLEGHIEKGYIHYEILDQYGEVTDSFSEWYSRNFS